jgi:hypothetical protein
MYCRYTLLLENRDRQLRAAVQALYSLLAAGQPWPGTPLQLTDNGRPRLNDILERLSLELDFDARVDVESYNTGERASASRVASRPVESIPITATLEPLPGFQNFAQFDTYGVDNFNSFTSAGAHDQTGLDGYSGFDSESSAVLSEPTFASSSSCSYSNLHNLQNVDLQNLQNVGLQNIDLQNTDLQNVQDIGLQNIGLQDIGLQNMGLQDMGLQDIGLQDIGLQNMGLQDMGLQDIGLQDIGLQNDIFSL